MTAVDKGWRKSSQVLLSKSKVLFTKSQGLCSYYMMENFQRVEWKH